MKWSKDKNRVVFVGYSWLLLLVVCVFPVSLFAQATFGSGTDVTDTPIDGGLSLLVAAGIGYGVKKLYSKKNNNPAE